MKKILFLLSFCLFLANLNAQIETPAASPAASVMQQIGLAKVTISYGRPSLKGRKMLGSANVPYDKVWRTGANKVTNIEVSDDVQIEGKTLPKGTYALVTIPTAKDWTVTFNKGADQWGTYEYKAADDVFSFKVTPEMVKTNTETMTFEFDNSTPLSADVVFKWENVKFKFAISHAPEAKIMADIKAKTADPTKITDDTYYDVADYYIKQGIELKTALEYATALVKKDPQYWSYALQAKAYAKLNQCTEAIDAAKKGYALAEKNKDEGSMASIQKIIDGCKK